MKTRRRMLAPALWKPAGGFDRKPARALGLEIPPELLLLADKVIE